MNTHTHDLTNHQGPATLHRNSAQHSTTAAAAAAAASLQSCPTLCDPTDGSPPGSSVHGIFQARVLEWGAIAFSTQYSMLTYMREKSEKE